jgi:hypothetical protein
MTAAAGRQKFLADHQEKQGDNPVSGNPDTEKRHAEHAGMTRDELDLQQRAHLRAIQASAT